MERLLRDCVTAVAVLLCVATQMLCQLCQQPCLCTPLLPPRCPAGVPLVPDGCGCGCRVCARQRGQSCTRLLPCDATRGLQCDDSAAFPGEPGECVGREDLSCQVGGVTYQDGQSFQPSCDSRCHCRGGGVACVPACPLIGRLPSPDCPRPQHVRLPGRCCREWVCEDLENSVIQDAIAALRPDRKWPSPPAVPPLTFDLGRGAADRPVTSDPAAPPPCAEQSSQWSACSQSCGAGVSTRVSNVNPACKLQLETRLCKVRPCHGATPTSGKHLVGRRGRCKSSYASAAPVRLVHQGCYSSRAFRLRYCGQCADGRCCAPRRATTAHVTFRCPSGRRLRRAVMMIRSCTCHDRCPYAPFTNPALLGLRP